MKKSIVVLLVLLLASFYVFAEDKGPKNAKFISQSCSQDYLYLTVINLDTNEIIVLQYGTKMGGDSQLRNVIHTGMIVNPEDETNKSGTDAPFEKPKNNTK